MRAPASALYAFCRLADDAVDLGGGRAAAVLVGYCDKCLGPIVGGGDVSPNLFAAAGGRADQGGVIEVDWWLEE